MFFFYNGLFMQLYWKWNHCIKLFMMLNKSRLVSDLYVPGFISLLLLLPLSTDQLLHHPALQKQYTLEVNYYDPTDLRPEPVPFPPARDYFAIDIAGDIKEDESKLREAKLTVDEMLRRRDTLKGLKIHFGPTARYESFVRAIEICSVGDSLTYTLYQDDLWIYVDDSNIEPAKPRFVFVCGTMFMTRELSQSDSFFETFPIAHYGTKFWPSALVLMVLAVFSFTRMITGHRH
jgi:hypothetical protein